MISFENHTKRGTLIKRQTHLAREQRKTSNSCWTPLRWMPTQFRHVNHYCKETHRNIHHGLPLVYLQYGEPGIHRNGSAGSAPKALQMGKAGFRDPKGNKTICRIWLWTHPQSDSKGFFLRIDGMGHSRFPERFHYASKLSNHRGVSLVPCIVGIPASSP